MFQTGWKIGRRCRDVELVRDECSKRFGRLDTVVWMRWSRVNVFVFCVGDESQGKVEGQECSLSLISLLPQGRDLFTS
jgi:hypothetical protein